MLSSSQNITIDGIARDVKNIHLNKRAAKADYSELFYYHLTSLIKFKLLSNKNNVDELKINQRNYIGLEQFIFENSNLVESNNPADINWDLVDEGKDTLKTQLQKLLKHEGKSNHLKPIISFTVDSFEKWLIYKQLHPQSVSNPWIPTNDILHKGYLYLVSDNTDLIRSYQTNIYSNIKDENRGNVGIVTKSDGKREFSGFIVDNRNKLQSLVYEFLRREAPGARYEKTLKQIRTFLGTQNIRLTENEIRNRITIPLKRAGLIGSRITGFYYIDSVEDLIYTYLHHKEKLKGVQRTIDLYIEKAKKMGIDDIEKFIEHH